ncbi:gag-pol protein [Lasius niger]|uniref:Gag-pol protein n=1 Tax=Lasius niger TaxID=67767 RepID=A0A0J7K2A9_LASNI|nr:gag-pol protein [Lasius niger]
MLQIRVHHEDIDLQRILWRKDQKHPLKDYRLTTVTYGTTCAPYLALRVLRQLAEDDRSCFSLGAKIIESYSYVDDIVAGADTVQQVKKARQELSNILSSGGFPLSKWAANCSDIHPTGDTNPRRFQEVEGVSTLELTWSPVDDAFSLNVTLLPSHTSITKRSVLSEVSRLFYPLGWIAPVVIIGKIMIQDLWIAGINWDQTLPPELSEKWVQFRTTLPELETLKISRWVSVCDSNTATIKLISFCDASKQAYAAAVYLRATGSNRSVYSNLLVAKTKVTPVKTQSIPRLELCGAVLLTRLIKTVCTKLNLLLASIFAWTDLQVVLAWIRAMPPNGLPFVVNCVAEIQTTLSATHWGYLRTNENPADLATRGISPRKLIGAKLWWQGPAWLRDSESSWPSALSESQVVEEVGISTTTVLHATVEPELYGLLSKYSSLSKLIQILALWFRYLYNLRHKDNRHRGFLSAAERLQALKFTVKLSQRAAFGDDIADISKGRKLRRNSPLTSFNQFLDEDGLLRVGGRPTRHSFL